MLRNTVKPTHPLRSTDAGKVVAEERAEFQAEFAELAARFPNLTPLEIRIRILCKHEYTSMQIAVALGVSDKTIDNHRTKIRKKLSLDRSTRLDSFLLSL